MCFVESQQLMWVRNLGRKNPENSNAGFSCLTEHSKRLLSLECGSSMEKDKDGSSEWQSGGRQIE
eukprot:2840976-Amphidinium_carterae.1